MDWSSLIIELPLVAAFIWYSLELNTRYQKSMDKRDEAYLATLEKISQQIDRHDQEVTERLDKLTARRTK